MTETFSLASTIDHVAPRLPPALVAPEALGGVRVLAASLPAALTSWIDFECRLDESRPQVDLSIRRERRRRDRLAAVCAARGESSGSMAWRRVAAFAGQWAGGPQALLEVAAAWLEFDLDASGAATARPRLFIDFDRRAYARTDPVDRVRAIVNVLEPMVGSPAPAWLSDGVAACLRELPPSAELLYVGLPAGERIAAVRLCMLGVDDQRAADYLERVGWCGNVAALRRTLGAISKGKRAVTRGAILHIDLNERGRIGSRIGLEFPFQRRSQVRGVVADTEFLDDLVGRGACAAGKRDAILTWPGCEMAILPHAIWPSLVLRRISHVKIVFDGDEPPEAKAYLCVAHAWRPELTADRRSACGHTAPRTCESAARYQRQFAPGVGPRRQ